MGATPNDVVEFALRQMNASCPYREKRIIVEKINDEWYARPFQGVSKEVEAVYGGDYEPGQRISRGDYDCLFHGISSPNAAYIRQEGIFCGGLSAYRAHIHMVTTVRDSRDYSTGVRRVGVKGDAYVMIDLDELFEYH